MSDCVDRSGQVVFKYMRLLSNTKEEKSNEEE
jgi:hypothetical protein